MNSKACWRNSLDARKSRCLIVASRFKVVTSAVLLSLLLQGHSIAVTAAAELQTNAARDFVFFLLSDVHVGAEDLKATPPRAAADSIVRVQKQLDVMRSFVGQTAPERFERQEAIPTPRALILLGDLTDGHKEPARQEEQWLAFEKLFPVTGVAFGDTKVPALALAGNHDGEISGPQRKGLVARNRELLKAGQLKAISTNGVHFAVNWQGLHLVGLGLCAADSTDTETPFKYGKPGPGSWNDPQGAFSFLKQYLESAVGKSGEPVILMQHYGFDGFSMNDWNWWTPKQRRALYELLANYNIAGIFHGHNHHAEHYRWPDPKLHAADVAFFFDGKPPASHRQYDVLSCGEVCWVIQVRDQVLTATHRGTSGWSPGAERSFVKDLKPQKP